MLKGAKPAGIIGSLKALGRATGAKLTSKTSTVPACRLAAYRYELEPLVPMARPVYSAPAAELSTITTALPLFTPGFHPDIVPSKVSKRNTAGLPVVNAKPVVLFQTVPVGLPCVPPVLEGGMVTTSGIMEPVVL